MSNVTNELTELDLRVNEATCSKKMILIYEGRKQRLNAKDFQVVHGNDADTLS